VGKTIGRVIGVKRTTETIVTATGTIATHVEASNEAGVLINGMVRAAGAEGYVALVGIKVEGKMRAELMLHPDGHISLYDFTGDVTTVAS